jgi:hypothetical protein
VREGFIRSRQRFRRLAFPPAMIVNPAILITLIQGNWTATLRGKNNTTGVALLEVYRIQ